MQWIADARHIFVAVAGSRDRPYILSVKETPDQILMIAKASPMNGRPQIA
jgi:hypothetical protein